MASTPPAATPTRNNADDEAARAAREAEAARLRAENERKMALLSERIFFGYDRSEISSEAAAILQAKLPVLRENQTVRLRVEGHADERGSIEYNLALGLRRAQAVKDYLGGFGIDASRLTIESFGEDRPLDGGTIWVRLASTTAVSGHTRSISASRSTTSPRASTRTDRTSRPLGVRESGSPPRVRRRPTGSSRYGPNRYSTRSSGDRIVENIAR
jgi:peptidoglycan-associated lipoprotein